jgi:hypothetical protein
MMDYVILIMLCSTLPIAASAIPGMIFLEWWEAWLRHKR